MKGRFNFLDAIHLSWRNIIGHKGRSLIIVIVISALFGLLMGINFILRGLEISLLDVSLSKTAGKAYVETYYQDLSKTVSDERISARLEKYNGKKLGYFTRYDFGVQVNVPFMSSMFSVVDSSVVKDFLTTELDQVPDNKIPILAPAGGFNLTYDNEQYDWLRSQISERYYIVGYLPIMVTSEQSSLTYKKELGYADNLTPTISKGFNLLNLVLGDIYAGVKSDMLPMLIDDGSGRIDAYVSELTSEWNRVASTQIEEWEDSRPERTEHIVAVFTSKKDLIDYTAPVPEEMLGNSAKQVTLDFVSNPSNITLAFHSIWLKIVVLEIIALIVAAIITVFTFSHLIDQDASTIALYRSMGASSNNIYLIYLLYLIELCLFAILTSFLLGAVISAIMAGLNVGELSKRLEEFYLLSEAPHVSLFGFDQNFWYVVSSILITAPIVLAFTQKRFSARHIAKKLKED